MAIPELMDLFAKTVATGYLRGDYSFGAADMAMNQLFSFAHVETGLGLSEFASQVFGAFDEGEYISEGVSSGEQGEARTRKMLSGIRSLTGSVLLIFTSPNRDPGEVTVALGLTPFKAWRSGERKSAVLPDGTLMQFDSTHERSGWKAFLRDRDKDSSLQEQAAFWLRELATRKGPIAQLQKLGWEAEVNCFSAGTMELELEPDELALLGGLSVRLAVFALCSTGTVRPDDSSKG